MALSRLTNWYVRHERLLSSLALVVGFIVDSLTLRRVDLLWENLWVGILLSAAALGILCLNIFENKKQYVSEKVATRIHFWLIIIVQFAFGGLLSAFLVFYFRSGTLATSWPFIVVLTLFFISNEVLKHHYNRLVFQISILFFSIYSFAIFIVPVVMHAIGPWIFILSGIASLCILAIFLLLLRYIGRERFRQSRRLLYVTIGGLTVLINVLYFTNLIPPIPLSLKEAGVYHDIIRENNDYRVIKEVSPWWAILKFTETVHMTDAAPLFVFTSVFSPTDLNTNIVHDWQYYNTEAGDWQSMSVVKLPIVGGRDDGYRTYSIKTAPSPGLWRVEVKTLQNQVIGRIKFIVEEVAKTPELLTEIR